MSEFGETLVERVEVNVSLPELCINLTVCWCFLKFLSLISLQSLVCSVPELDLILFTEGLVAWVELGPAETSEVNKRDELLGDCYIETSTRINIQKKSVELQIDWV